MQSAPVAGPEPGTCNGAAEDSAPTIEGLAADGYRHRHQAARWPPRHGYRRLWAARDGDENVPQKTALQPSREPGGRPDTALSVPSRESQQRTLHATTTPDSLTRR